MPTRNRLVNDAAQMSPERTASIALQNRALEALRVYRPGTKQQQRIHTSPANTLIVSGANRSGKTVCGAVEIASRILGIPVRGSNDEPIQLRFPVPKTGENFEYWFIGHDWNHIGQTVFRVFFEPGLFYAIWDELQQRYVTWNETIRWHLDGIAKRLPVGPVIPSRFIDENSWTWNPQGGGKEKHGFDSVRLTNGAVIRAFPSSAPQAKQGDPIRGLWIDEDVKFGQHVPEYFARLGDYGGWAYWGAWPHDENYQLSNLIEGAELAMESGDPRSEHVQLSALDNPFLSTEKKRLQIDRFSMLGGEELVASRMEGEQHVEGRRMYDFRPLIHAISSDGITRAVPALDPQTPRGVVQKIYREAGGRLPLEWTRYLAIDPSTTRTAVQIGCVPPPTIGEVEMPPVLIHEYEIVLKRATCMHVALAIKESAEGRVFEAFIIDKQFGQQTHQAAGMASWDVFYKAFDEIGLKSRTTDSFFIPGCNVPGDRYTWVRNLLSNANTHRPQLWVILDTTPHTQKEFLRYMKKKETIQGVERVTDVPENPRKYDCMAGLEYLVAYVGPLMTSGVAYVEPELASTTTSAMADTCSLILGQRSKYIHLGPGQAA